MNENTKSVLYAVFFVLSFLALVVSMVYFSHKLDQKQIGHCYEISKELPREVEELCKTSVCDDLGMVPSYVPSNKQPWSEIKVYCSPKGSNHDISVSVGFSEECSEFVHNRVNVYNCMVEAGIR